MKIIFILSLLIYMNTAFSDTSYSKIKLSSTVPTEVNGGSNPSKQDLATFAWQEFVALNWPAAIDYSIVVGDSGFLRGQPSPDALASTGSGGTLVWQTYHHRVELYPYAPPAGKNQLPDINAEPNYIYPSYVNINKENSNVNLKLFSNLDEASEISLAFMYYKPFISSIVSQMKKHGVEANYLARTEVNKSAIKAALVYEAKTNNIIYNYVKSSGFQDKDTRDTAAAETFKKINNMPYDKDKTFEFPNGSIETKATWRRYDSTVDNLNDYIWKTGIYYTGKSPNFTAHNAKMLLIGLHIIQKTPNFPSFTFATFEHINNEKDGFVFNNTNPMTNTVVGIERKLPDPGTIEAKRQFKIPDASKPFNLQLFNTNVQSQITSSYTGSTFLAKYQLIGIQAEVVDNPNTNVPPQEFYLSNFATETNDTLQFFQGGLVLPQGNVPDPNMKQVRTFDTSSNMFVAHSSGGCMGCHGAQGQQNGYDFSVISKNGNFFSPEPIEPYPGGAIVPQNALGFPLPQSN